MGRTDELNSSKPPRFLEKLAALAIPRDSREQVLGDLHERYVSPLGYLTDAATAVPASVISRLLKRCPLPYVLLEFFLAYAGMLIAAFMERNLAPIWGGGPPDFLKCTAAAGYLTIVLVWRDAYARDYSPVAAWITGPRLRKLVGLWRVEGDVFLSVYFAFGLYYVFCLMMPSIKLFPGIMTNLNADWTVPALLLPLRIWLARRSEAGAPFTLGK